MLLLSLRIFARASTLIARFLSGLPFGTETDCFYLFQAAIAGLLEGGNLGVNEHKNLCCIREKSWVLEKTRIGDHSLDGTDTRAETASRTGSADLPRTPREGMLCFPCVFS